MWPQQIDHAWPLVYQHVYNTLRRWGVKRAEAEDVAAEATLFAAERALGQTFVNDEHCEHWLYRVALRRAIDLLRARGRHVPQALLDDLAPAPALEPAGWEGIVRRCHARLTARQRRILTMRYRDGLTLREVAELQLPADGRSPQGRITAIRREEQEALDVLRRALEDEGVDPEAW